MDETSVTFSVKDYRHEGKWKELTLSGIEFIRRFLMHVPPSRFVRIRHYGLLCSRNKNKKLALCRNLLGGKKYLSKLKSNFFVMIECHGVVTTALRFGTKVSCVTEHFAQWNICFDMLGTITSFHAVHATTTRVQVTENTTPIGRLNCRSRRIFSAPRRLARISRPKG